MYARLYRSKKYSAKKYNLTKPSAKQKELLQRVGLPSLINRKIVHKANNDLIYAE